VLILDGFSNHNWKLNTRLLRGLLQPTGLFEIAVSTCPAQNSPEWEKWQPDFAHADVIIQTCNDISQRPAPKWPEPVKVSFVDFVKNGGGVLVYHSGNNAFPDWLEYNDIIGIGWRPVTYGTALQLSEDGQITRIPPGQGRATGHAAREEVLVRQLGEHPIHEGMPKTWKTPALEVYYSARGPANNVQVISYGLDPRFKEYWPLEWTVTYGQGRVYSSSFGHVWSDESETKQPVDLLAVDEQILIQRTLQWLAKKPVTVPIPKNFPTAKKASLSENIPLPKD
jgi:type 1 glutamine amidotransferase